MMDIPRLELVLTKEEAASRQAEAAIDALERGQFDIALTLAGAAEGMIKRDGPHMFSFMLESERVRHITRKDWITALNRERDWLKHGGDDAMTIDLASAAFMIARALSKLEKWTQRMDEFKVWLLTNLDDICEKN